jgi:glycerophosphoryl diester phosphodiesterase
MAEQVAISSFSPASLAAMRTATPGLPRWLLSTAWGEAQWRAAEALAVAGIAPHQTAIDAELVARARRQGLAVVAWTANDEADLRRLLALAIDVIVTDDPARAVRLRDAAGAPPRP